MPKGSLQSELSEVRSAPSSTTALVHVLLEQRQVQKYSCHLSFLRDYLKLSALRSVHN